MLSTRKCLFLASKLKTVRSPVAFRGRSKDLGFGTYFSPHMLEADYDDGKWGDPVIKPYGNLEIPPQASCLNYAVQAFEGMKAYADHSGVGVRVFRPECNAKRLLSSCDRLGLPCFAVDDFLECVKALVLLDRDVIPKEYGYSLYIRPCVIGMAQKLGAGASDTCKLYVIMTPTSTYCESSVKLAVEGTLRRAWPGGIGEYKLGANYAPTVKFIANCKKEGCDNVLWLGNGDRVEEGSVTNFMVLWRTADGKRELITAPLEGTILPGITRDSILTMCREWGEFQVSERWFTIHELIAAIKNGQVEEMFVCGTAAICTAVKELRCGDEKHLLELPPEQSSIAKRLHRELLDIQTGKVAHKWSVKWE